MDSETASSVYTRDQTGLTPDERIGARFAFLRPCAEKPFWSRRRGSCWRSWKMRFIASKIIS